MTYKSWFGNDGIERKCEELVPKTSICERLILVESGGRCKCSRIFKRNMIYESTDRYK